MQYSARRSYLLRTLSCRFRLEIGGACGTQTWPANVKAHHDGASMLRGAVHNQWGKTMNRKASDWFSGSQEMKAIVVMAVAVEVAVEVMIVRMVMI